MSQPMFEAKQTPRGTLCIRVGSDHIDQFKTMMRELSVIYQTPRYETATDEKEAARMSFASLTNVVEDALGIERVSWDEFLAMGGE